MRSSTLPAAERGGGNGLRCNQPVAQFEPLDQARVVSRLCGDAQIIEVAMPHRPDPIERPARSPALRKAPTLPHISGLSSPIRRRRPAAAAVLSDRAADQIEMRLRGVVVPFRNFALRGELRGLSPARSPKTTAASGNAFRDSRLASLAPPASSPAA